MKRHWFHRWVDIGFVGGITLPIIGRYLSVIGSEQTGNSNNTIVTSVLNYDVYGNKNKKV